MSGLVDLDLRSPEPTTSTPTDPAWYLVRYGRHVIGDLRMSVESAPDASPREIALEWFATEIHARANLAPDLNPMVAADDVTIIVCTRDRPEFLRGCLESMAALDPAPARVIVVDNAPSDDRAADVVRDFGFDHVVEPVPGLDRARNTGWRASATEVVAFVDDDARADGHLVEALRHGFVDESVGAVTGLVVGAELSTRAQIAFEMRGGMRKGFAARIHHPGSVGLEAYRLGVGTNMAFRRTALEAVGGFDPHLDVGTPSRGGGDLDALWRVLESGHDIAYEPDAVVRHIHRRSRQGLIAQHHDYGTAYRAFLERVEQRHPGRRREVRAEVRRWHLRRHGRDVLAAVRRRDGLTARLLMAEAVGSRSGQASLRGTGVTAHSDS